MLSLEDLSIHSHTAKFIFEKILEIVNAIGLNKISFIISDNASTMVKTKQMINDKYNHIISISCIAYYVNFLITDIMKHKYSKKIIMKCIKIIKYFCHSYQANTLLYKELEDILINGEGLKGYYKTRWTTAWNCLESIRRCKVLLYNIRIFF